MQPTEFVTGLHHVTVCVGGAQEDIDFATEVLGLRMIKQTVLFDGAASIYHLYYANAEAQPGSVWTTFPFRQAGVHGRKGTGQIEFTGFSAPGEALDFWARHLNRHGVEHGGVEERFGDQLIRFQHPSGLGLEVVGNDADDRTPWTTGHISADEGIRGFYNVTLAVRETDEMGWFLEEVLKYEKVGQDGAYHRYRIRDGGPGRYVDLHHLPDEPQGSWTFGAGTAHHVAFGVLNDEQDLALKAYLEGVGFTDTSDLKDRNYFHSIYVRTPGGVLFEFATSDIGFAVDEPMDKLGEKLLLPPWFEDRREEIMAPLEPITVPEYIRVSA
jgi:catechol 2,3-dioxygenase-like lactoylglutathione lyase family enzyme